MNHAGDGPLVLALLSSTSWAGPLSVVCVPMGRDDAHAERVALDRAPCRA